MPRPHAAIPHFLPPLHIYRHILRETSYLPPAIRPAIHTQIQTRFRNHRKNDRLRDKHLAQGTKTLRHLRAANSGESFRMESLMMKAFGRAGARRRSLLSDYVKLGDPTKAKVPSNSDDLEKLIKDVESMAKSPETNPTGTAEATTEVESSPNEQQAKSAEPTPSDEIEKKPISPRAKREPKPLQPAFYHKWDTEKLNTLLQSQKALQESAVLAWPKRPIKSLNPDKDIPEKNIWGQPPTENVCQAKRARFWRRAADKIMPPVNNEEWELLGRLSKGAQEEDEQWQIPQRRPSAKAVLAEDSKLSTLDWNWESYATQPTNRIERKSPHTAFSFVGRDREKHPYQSRIEHKELTPRWFRRAYQRVWQFTPREASDQKPKTKKNAFEFGALPISVVPASKAQLEIFEGVNAMGQKLKDRPQSQEALESDPETEPELETEPETHP
ncbi:Ff.00g105040.m01.CDS01 [Fusarium sp. VM40]|nr:Ff.00g105040.m01.CDS01 [Fusarium sp. VM40]